ncbi:MAG: hypothetical protein UT02_C0021G0014 [Parcubacteria group bacterium GW2011_GWC2_38_7]|nr:MAG: hypothetical protein UT02_C0021G0014 [Parcubacteria group bacterium GW2011_GWC2_38_7]
MDFVSIGLAFFAVMGLSLTAVFNCHLCWQDNVQYRGFLKAFNKRIMRRVLPLIRKRAWKEAYIEATDGGVYSEPRAFFKFETTMRYFPAILSSAIENMRRDIFGAEQRGLTGWDLYRAVESAAKEHYTSWVWLEDHFNEYGHPLGSPWLYYVFALIPIAYGVGVCLLTPYNWLYWTSAMFTCMHVVMVLDHLWNLYWYHHSLSHSVEDIRSVVQVIVDSYVPPDVPSKVT